MYLVLMCIAAPVVATACNSPSIPTQVVSPSSLTADQVVQRYYEDIAKHDIKDASAWLAPDVAKFYYSSPDSDFNNLSGLSDLSVSKPYNIPADNKYKYEVQVDVTYEAHYDRVITSYSGGQTRFVYLGRNKTTDPWLILSIGTGP